MSYFGIPIRNGLPIGLGSVAPLASGGGSPFSPLSLFSGGAPGAWYDPSDLTTLFQDSAGTTPVTAVEQPVGLMLDKSQGLVLGSELVTNGDFSNGDTGWILSAGVTVSGGTANWTAGASNLSARQTGILTVGKTYQVTYTISSISSGGFKVSIGAEGPIYTSAGTYTARLTASSTQISILSQGASTTGSIDNITVKELPGNHAFQSTSASRPVLSARYNLLTKTEQFDDAAWVKRGVTTVTANSTTAPDGTLTADTINNLGTDGVNDIYLNTLLSISSSTQYTVSFYVKRISTSGTIYFKGIPSSGNTAAVNLSTIGSDWYRVSLNVTSSVGQTSMYYQLHAAATGPLSFYIWGASLVVSAQAPTAYQRVNTTTDYNTTGFLPYLRFDGVDDSLSTNSISFTSTDKMTVFAGVRKLSDAEGAIAELSAAWFSNNGTFAFNTWNSPSGYSLGLRGNSAAPYFYKTGAFASPVSNVVTSLYDIAGATSETEVQMRVNAAAATLTVAGGSLLAGTGNFGNYPLYIGRRGNSSLPFNGQLYSMIIVGKAVTATELANTEKYVNQKTGAY